MDEFKSYVAQQGDVPGPDVIAADLARGRAALHRRRAAKATAAIALVSAAAVVVTYGPWPSPSHTRIADRPARTSGAHVPGSATLSTGRAVPKPTVNPAAIELVAYTGRQVPGFRVTMVPRGLTLLTSTPTSLDIGRAGDVSGSDDYVDKLVVQVQPAGSVAPGGAAVLVNGRPGRLLTGDRGVRVLSFSDGERHVRIQAWPTIALSDAQLVRFADSITVTTTARPVGG
jgi:hypothetical protein